MMRFVGSAFFITGVMCAVTPSSVTAGKRGSGDAGAAASTAEAVKPQRHMFYPQEVEGGVTGNLPFNNQIRKHTDPLNANGAR